jgi:hypothetical protein
MDELGVVGAFAFVRPPRATVLQVSGVLDATGVAFCPHEIRIVQTLAIALSPQIAILMKFHQGALADNKIISSDSCSMKQA